MNQQERSDKIEEYGRGFAMLEAARAGLPREAWQFRPAAGEWSIHEILVHMADSECMGVLRLHKLIAEPGSTLMPYEESKWAEALRYREQDADDALQIFKLLRKKTYGLLKSLSEQTFSHSVIHPEWTAPFTLEEWLNIYTRHVPEHIEQLEKTADAWRKQRKPSG